MYFTLLRNLYATAGRRLYAQKGSMIGFDYDETFIKASKHMIIAFKHETKSKYNLFEHYF